MKQKKIKVKLKKWDEKTYHLETTEKYSKYLGEIYYLKNEKEYSIIYCVQIPSLSGPPSEKCKLIETGRLRKNLDELLLKVAKEIRQKEEKKRNLEK